MKFKPGDLVRKPNGYLFYGVVTAAFYDNKIEKIVVRNIDGLSHIFGFDQLVSWEPEPAHVYLLRQAAMYEKFVTEVRLRPPAPKDTCPYCGMPHAPAPTCPNCGRRDLSANAPFKPATTNRIKPQTKKTRRT